MPQVSEKLTKTRKEEIINACEKLYQTMSFKEITLKDIADLTTFTRTSIYNYFQTKEEIFLTLNKIEYERWIVDLENIIETNTSMTKDEIADSISRSLEKRTQMLKLMSMNNFDMEANSRIEILIEFKVAYGNSIKTIKNLIKKFCKDMNTEDINEFVFTLSPFIYGIYPYTAVNDRQKEAMRVADVGFVYHSIYELSYSFIKKMLD